MRTVGIIGLSLALAVSSQVFAAQVKVVRAGMTEAEVRGAWGEPLTVRQRGTFTYMFYENGCLRTCGMHDLVILEGGQVTDAIARASYHSYDGVSSSPRERVPTYTPPTVP